MKGWSIRFRINRSSSKDDIYTGREKPDEAKVETPTVWLNVIIFLIFHFLAFYGVYMCFIGEVKLITVVVSYIIAGASGYGVTAGAHRYWCHRSYKAKTPLRLLLIFLDSVAFQNSILEWCRDHRVHHKFTETDGDPHNSRRGFFFAHMGWLMCKKHPDVKEKGKIVDLTDLKEDPIVMFQHRHYLKVILVCSIILPILVVHYGLGETWKASVFVGFFLRYVYTLHSTWLVNSAAHMWGYRPYDKSIRPAENIVVSFFAYGEGWHNYHHSFPWDYKTSELPFYRWNLTTGFIDFFAMLGWAYDLKTVGSDMIRRRAMRSGDGSHPIWGWGDKDMPKEHLDVLQINNNTQKEE